VNITHFMQNANSFYLNYKKWWVKWSTY
jgi:hypothetical protein